MAGLQQIRDSFGHPIIKVLVGAIVISFALFFGWGTVFSSSDVNSIATVNGINIDLYDLDLEMRKIESNLNRTIDDPNFKLEEELLKTFSIESLVSNAVIVDYLNNSGAIISDLTAYRLLAKNETFLEEGKFSLQRVDSFARQNGILPGKYLNEIKKDIALNFWSSGLLGSNFITTNEINRNIKLASQTRDIIFFKINSSNFEKEIKINQKEVSNFYLENPNYFVTEEEAKVRYLKISLENLLDEIEVTDQEIESEYKAYLRDYDNSVRRSASHIMLEISNEVSKEEAILLARDLKQKINSGELFEDLVLKYSEDEGTKNLQGSLGTSDGSFFPQEFESALIQLKVGEVSEPILLENSVHLVKLDDIREPLPEDLNKMRGLLEEDLTKERASFEFSYLLEEVADLSFSLNNLKDLSKEVNIEFKETDYFTKANPQDNFQNLILLEKIFSDFNIQKGQLSELIEVNDEEAFIFEVIDFRDKRIKEFEEVKVLAKNELKKYLLEEKISSVESSILNSLNTGNSLDEVSTDFGLKIQSYKGLTRDSSLLPRNVLAEIFDEPRSNLASSYSSISLAGGDKLIFRLEGINESAMSITKEEKATLQDFFLKERSNSELLELQANMRDEASVSIKKSFN